jgi:hypothetical protein
LLTLEVNGQLVTWPEEFAQMMMNHYRNHGVTFLVQRNCTHCGRDKTTETVFASEKIKLIGAYAFSYRCRLLSKVCMNDKLEMGGQL